MTRHLIRNMNDDYGKVLILLTMEIVSYLLIQNSDNCSEEADIIPDNCSKEADSIRHNCS